MDVLIACLPSTCELSPQTIDDQFLYRSVDGHVRHRAGLTLASYHRTVSGSDVFSSVNVREMRLARCRHRLR